MRQFVGNGVKSWGCSVLMVAARAAGSSHRATYNSDVTASLSPWPHSVRIKKPAEVKPTIFDRNRHGFRRCLWVMSAVLGGRCWSPFCFRAGFRPSRGKLPFPGNYAEPPVPAPDATLHERQHGSMEERDSMVGSPEGLAGSHDGMDMEGGHHHRVDTEAPAFLWGDHVHMAGEWMVSYHYSNVYMHGNQSGTTPLTNQQALDFIGTVPPGMPGMDAFMFAPIGMTMEMHMLHIMRGITDDVTAYVMPMWMDNTMEQLNRDGSVFRSTTSGFSDTEFGALWRIHKGKNDDLIINVGFRLPRPTSTQA